MKKILRKLDRYELLTDFIAFTLLIAIGGCFLLFLIIRITSNLAFLITDIRLIMLAVAGTFLVLMMAGVSFYRRSASYIRWYRAVLDSIPMPVIVTDKSAEWLQINKSAREIMNLGRHSEIEGMSSSHLIEPNGSVMEKIWIDKGTEYRVSGCRLEEGYLIFINELQGLSDSNKTRAELIDEINKLFGRLSTVAAQFHDCASNLAGCTVRQEHIINDLTDVITGIAAGEYQEVGTLNEKMCSVKSNMEQHVENNQSNLETVRRTVQELDITREFIGNVLHNMETIPKK